MSRVPIVGLVCHVTKVVYSMWVVLVPSSAPRRAHCTLLFGFLVALYGFLGIEIFFNLLKDAVREKKKTCTLQNDVDIVPCKEMDYLIMLTNLKCKCHPLGQLI